MCCAPSFSISLSPKWFSLLSHMIFNPKFGLFKYSAHDNCVLINQASGVNSKHLEYFKFIGRVFGLAILHRRFLDVSFVPAFYKIVLARKLGLKDLEAVDYELYKGLLWENLPTLIRANQI